MAILNFFDTLAIQPNFFADADIDIRVDKKVLSDTILRRCGTLQPVYTNTEMFKYLSDNFFYEKRDVIRKLIDSTVFEYNPIENYDRKQEISRDESVTAGIGSSVTATPNTTQTTSGDTTNNSEQKVSAYDADSYQPKEKAEVHTSEGSVTTNTGTVKTETTQHGTDKTTEKTTIRSHGNIGVTTTQSLIEQERKIAMFNIYHWLAIEFEQEFFICVS